MYCGIFGVPLSNLGYLIQFHHFVLPPRKTNFINSDINVLLSGINFPNRDN